MNPYQPSTPRVAFGVAAVAMTLITIGLSVIAPARMDFGTQEVRVLAASPARMPATEAVAETTRIERIDVVGVREPKLTVVQLRSAPPKRKQQS